MTVYEKDGIKITRRNVFGKIGLAGHNANNKATVTAFATSEEEIAGKVARMVIELEKNTVIDLTDRLTKLEERFLQHA